MPIEPAVQSPNCASGAATFGAGGAAGADGVGECVLSGQICGYGRRGPYGG